MKWIGFRHVAVVWCLISAGYGMTVGTYNIRYDNPGDVENGNAWPRRAPVIAGLIRFHDFDVLGTQEGFQHQMEDLREALTGYGCSAYGRDDGDLGGEQIGIFYKKAKFELLDRGRFWISETPEEPGRGWDADLPRLCAWAQLREKAGDREFFFFNLHMDHRGRVSRKEGAELVLRRIDEITAGAPTVLVGDFNTDQNREPYRLLTGDTDFADAYRAASIRYAPNGTANNFDPTAKTESRIDHVFVHKGFGVRRYGVLTDTYRVPEDGADGERISGNFPEEVGFRDYETRLPSDHFPVLVELTWGPERGGRSVQ